MHSDHESDPYALPDVEVWYGHIVPFGPGWYWRGARLAHGPFTTQAEAVADARGA